MGAPDATVLAYRETCDTVTKEYPLRVATTACVAWIIAAIDAPAAAFFWWTAMAALLAAEALSYRSIFREERATIPLRIVAYLAALSAACSIVYTYPVWALLADGAPASLFAAAAFMAGTLIHLTVHNANTRLIYSSAAMPISLVFLAVGIRLSMSVGNLIPFVTVLLFLMAMIAAYMGRLESTRQINQAMAEALAEREAARRASEAKSQFLAKLSHELRTPLNGILGMAQALKQGAVSTDQKEQASIIASSGEMLLSILGEILDHAKVESNHFVLEAHPENIDEIISQTVSLFESAAANKGVLLSLDRSQLDERHLLLDGPRLRQALTNLIANAVKFTDSGAILVKASARRRPDSVQVDVRIDVRDTGIGIVKEDFDRIFEAFEQADNSITRRYGGTGLGLAICRGIAQAMRGDVSVVSSPGEGSTFSLSFTTEISTACEPARNARAGGMQTGARVLLVEDIDVNRKVARAILGPVTKNIVEAENGAIALEKLKEESFDVVLMDMHMPVMDGFAATRAIRNSDANWSAIPVIALTAAASEEDKRRCFAAGVTAFLSKPIKADELIAMICSHVEPGQQEDLSRKSVFA